MTVPQYIKNFTQLTCKILQRKQVVTSKYRLDQALVARKLVRTRSQAESYIKLGDVQVAGTVVTKPSHMVADGTPINLTIPVQYVSRAALKLASVAETLKLEFRDKIMLDIGSSTGGFTDYALRHGARRVLAVEVGTDQLHPSLRGNPKIDLHERTDIRNFETDEIIDLVVTDVSFISLREILPTIVKLSQPNTQIVLMVKPQFEATAANLKHRGVIKNDHMRRDILKSFEEYAGVYFMIIDKADSAVSGSKGNVERFYLLKKLAKTA
jgi:23S rRNA (cytidine1920-2'-O)/16S rRNA (cytidine1409-2'-O)-methyltransferase